MFALSPQAKKPVERTAATLKTCLITVLHFAGTTAIEKAKAVLTLSLPRCTWRFQIPA